MTNDAEIICIHGLQKHTVTFYMANWSGRAIIWTCWKPATLVSLSQRCANSTYRPSDDKTDKAYSWAAWKCGENWFTRGWKMCLETSIKVADHGKACPQMLTKQWILVRSMTFIKDLLIQDATTGLCFSTAHKTKHDHVVLTHIAWIILMRPRSRTRHNLLHSSLRFHVSWSNSLCSEK